MGIIIITLRLVHYVFVNFRVAQKYTLEHKRRLWGGGHRVSPCLNGLPVLYFISTKNVKNVITVVSFTYIYLSSFFLC